MKTITLWDLCGLVGVVLLLGAYALTVAGRLDARGVPALLLNLAGPVLILVSLARAFNLAAVAIEGAWALIALAGLTRRLAGARNAR